MKKLNFEHYKVFYEEYIVNYLCSRDVYSSRKHPVLAPTVSQNSKNMCKYKEKIDLEGFCAFSKQNRLN